MEVIEEKKGVPRRSLEVRSYAEKEVPRSSSRYGVTRRKKGTVKSPDGRAGHRTNKNSV